MVISSLGAGLSLLSMVVSGPSNSFLNSNDSNLLLASTSSVITPTNIGKFAKMEPVDSKTKVFIDEEDVDFVESLGITLTKEKLIIIDPTDPWIIDPIKSTSKSITKYLYYYYATPDGFDEITDVVMLDNTLDSLLIMVEHLEELIYETRPSFGINIIADLTTDYIRSLNSLYVSEYWTYLTNSIYKDINTHVNSIANRGITPYEYFGAFLPSNLYNSTSYPTIRAEYSVSNRPLPFIDPIDNTKEIDLIHMFASLSGICETASSYPFYLNTATRPNYTADLLSWGGDLQSTADIYRDEISYGFYFENVLLDSNSGSPREDIYADVDAYNIGFDYLEASYTYSLTAALTSYYSDIQTNQARFSLFYENLANDWDGETEVYNKQKRRIFYSLGIEISLENKISDISYSNIDLRIIGIDIIYIFNVMLGDSGVAPALLTRIYIAESFYDYVVRMAGIV